MTWRSTTLRFALLVFVLQVVSGIALLAITRVAVREQIARGAASRVETLREDLLVTYAQGGLPALASMIRRRTQSGTAPWTIVLLADSRGHVVAGDLARWPPSVPLGGAPRTVSLVRQNHVAPEPMLVRATPLPGGARLLTGVMMEGEERLLGYLEGSAAIGLLLALLFAALAAWLAARLIVARLGATVATLTAVRAGDLARRVDDDASGDVFAALARAVNETLERIDALVGELKIATDGLAHDLKSPLTRLRSALERAALVVHEPAAREAIDRALAEGERLTAIVRTALSITRAEAGVGRDSFVPVDLAAELHDIAEIYGPVAEEAGRTITVDAPHATIVPVHRELLAQALGNLVDNALTYGAGPIALRLATSEKDVTIAVEDRGPGIPPERRDQALARFGRLDDARRGPGAGLGLALVAAVARLHGGGVVLGDAGPGLIVSLRLRTDRPAA